jgi:metal-responsive CopG/Arc/MetJ family transcriptional regulator
MNVLHASATVIALHVQVLQQGTDAAEVIVVRGDALEIEELMLVTEGE